MNKRCLSADKKYFNKINIPVCIVFPAKNVIDVFLIGLIKLKPTVLFHKSDKPIRRHHGSSFAVFLTQLLLRETG